MRLSTSFGTPILSATAARFTALAALAALALLTIGVYWPGLSGGFIFDDFANLPALGRYGPVRDWDGLLRYLTSGIADPTGRPVSMLSFLMDARDWPADPLPFKRTNILIHSANGILLYGVLAALGRRIVADPAHARAAALVAAAAWSLHPLWASTVLYVVQRHAMLATIFVLAGIRLWVAGQDAFLRGKAVRGWLLAILAVPICGVLAGLSKANGFLLPLLLLALQLSILDRTARSATAVSSIHYRLSNYAFLVAPSVIVVAAILASGVLAWNNVTETRPWSMAERLMSQPRALFDYLYSLWIPRLEATGIFADAFPASTGILAPRTTLAAIVGIFVLAATGILARRRHPALSAAILFFLAGHAMESSVVPLELYFEHRNYLPATLLFWPLALWLTRRGPYMRFGIAATAGVLLIFGLITLAQAQVWGRPQDLARMWANALPDSARAQTHAASMDLRHNRPALAIARLSPLLASRPGEVQFALTLLDAHCSIGRVPAPALSAAAGAMSGKGATLDVSYQWLARTIAPESTAACSRLPTDTLAGLVLAATRGIGPSSAEEFRARKARLSGLVALRRSDCDAALAAFNARIDVQSRPEHASQQLGLLAVHCGPRFALAHLDHYEMAGEGNTSRMQTPMLRLRDQIVATQGYWEHEWRRLRRVLEADLAHESGLSKD